MVFGGYSMTGKEDFMKLVTVLRAAYSRLYRKPM